ncbi:DUF5641 domain-containing protein [Trichonephila clavipes]|uniref:DUF5641 domain-containing protein n=1 Tax=Trichonephila clavipes TaxID=2585209 RepID=A0A8X6S5Z5_TRICX|nr:DUF5641 domain-containing protein [Trichonephila clavipes]
MIDSKRLNKRCAYKLKLRQDLRNRFRNEYLGILKDYSRVKAESSIKEGDLILIGDANNKRINWPLGKDTKMYKGKDGKVHVMEVKTQFGSVMRPIQKLYPLEMTTVDSLPLTEIDVEDGPCLNQDQIPGVQRVRRYRYGRLLQQTKTLLSINYSCFLVFTGHLVLLFCILPQLQIQKVGECHKLPTKRFPIKLFLTKRHLQRHRLKELM